MFFDVSSEELDKVIKIVKDGGGEVFEKEGYINFCGVRNNSTNDTFNDILYIYWKDTKGGEFKCLKTKDFTTKPGKKPVINENGKVNSKGVAIVKEGWYPDVWHHGKHGGKYDALRQDVGVTKPITITRDKTQFNRRDGKYELRVLSDTTETGYPYTNMHRSGDPQGNSVNGWSEGCQVFKYKSDFDTMLKLTKTASRKGQKTFSYFLTNKNVFDLDGNSDNNKNTENLFEQSNNEDIFENNKSNTNKKDSKYSNNVSNLGNSGIEEYNRNEYEDGSSIDSNANIGEIIESPDSFGNKVIFTKVFPNDDNNKYINMKSEDICVIQYSEPSIKVEELNISDKSYLSSGVIAEKISYYIPVVFINDFMIPQTNITNFCLDYSSFAPQVMVEFVDITNNMLSTNITKPGSYIKVLIDGYGDGNYYKPIRQDFIITNINKTNKTGGEYQNYPNSGNPIKYKLTGILNVPMGFRKMSWCSSSVNARQAIFNISNAIGLGFATNFDVNNNVDVMKWVNTQNKSFYDFIREITQHSCYSPYTFFTSFIDQYYVLNYVECHRLLSHGGEKIDSPQMIYNCIMPDMDDKKSETGSQNNDLNNGNQMVSYYFLTNSSEFKGWTNYIEEYYELNDGYSIMSDGCRKTLTYSDKSGFQDVPSKNYRFLFTPIDNLKRDGNRTIMPLTENVGYDTYIPLNLVQTTSSSYIDNPNMYDNPSITESRVDLGEVDTSNNFPLYFYASVQNDFQMKNLKKCGLSVRLQNYNPSITRYSRIWLDIYDMNRNSLEEIRRDSNVDDMVESDVKDYIKNKNENILTFKEDIDKDNKYQVYNRSLSGWYVVTDMKISYNTVKDFKGKTYKKLQTQLILNRIEYKPTFKSEYEIARKAIEKYRTDNLSANIMCSGDII